MCAQTRVHTAELTAHSLITNYMYLALGKKCIAYMCALFVQELQKFARYIVRGFFQLAAKNPLLFAELLVWRTSGECYELVEGMEMKLTLIDFAH